MMKNCLLVGTCGAGKTLLSKSLKHWSVHHSPLVRGDESSSSVIATVGSNVEKLQLENCVVRLVELGGLMAPVWSASYNDCDMLIFVIDSTNMENLSASTVLLMEAIGHPLLSGKPMLVFFNEHSTGEEGRTPMSVLAGSAEEVTRIQDLRSDAVQVLHGNCSTGVGVDSILQWITDKTKLPV